MTGGGTLSLLVATKSVTSENDRESNPRGLLKAPTVPLRGMGTGVRDSRDTTLDSDRVVTDVTADVASENDQLSTGDPNVCSALTGASGGVKSLTFGEASVTRSRFCGVRVNDGSPLPNSSSETGGLPGDIISELNEDAEK